MAAPQSAKFWSPDAAAECLDVSSDTYGELWSWVSDDAPHRTCQTIWRKLSQTARDELRAAWKAQDAEWDAALKAAEAEVEAERSASL